MGGQVIDKHWRHICAPGNRTSAVDAVLSAIPAQSAIRVTRQPTASSRFGLSLLFPFFNGRLNRFSLRMNPGQVGRFRVEACGFVTRMQKGYCEFNAAGQLLCVGEEVVSVQINRQENGELLLTFELRAHRTRLEWLYLFAMPEGGNDGAEVWFDCGEARVEWDPDPDSAVLPSIKNGDGVLFAVNDLRVFRNLLHVEFELYKPGATMLGLSLVCSEPLETVQWWTGQKIGELRHIHFHAQGWQLEHRKPALALPSPELMLRLGPGHANLGHCIEALLKNLQDERLGQQLLSGLELRASFSDNTRIRLPLLGALADRWLDESPEFSVIAAYRQNLGNGRIPLFLEVGAHGDASAAVRKIIGDSYQYLGVDISEGANVDLIGDAHALSAIIEAASIDVVFTSCVMEHLLNPAQYVLEANKVLRPGGLFVATFPTTWPLHAEPWDYWRMSAHGWTGLLNRLSGFEIIHLREHGQASVVPSLAGREACDGLAQMQYAPAPMFTSVVARKIGESIETRYAWATDIAQGRYKP